MMKKSSIKVWIIGIILIVLLLMLSTKGMKDGISLNTNNNGISSLTSLSKLQKSYPDIEIPNFILDYEGELHIENIMGQLIQITSDDFAFKVTTFVDNNADPLGLYEEAGTDNKYNVNSSETNINFFRYRIDYEEYKNCTIINWCTEDRAYGVLIGKKLTEDGALELIDINKESLYAEQEKQEEIDTESSDTETYIIGNMFSIDLPKFKSDISMLDNNGTTSFYINKKLIFVILYNDYDIDSDAFSGQSELVVDNNIVIKYLSDNPFEVDTLAYNDYNTFVSTINNIKDSIVYQ